MLAAQMTQKLMSFTVSLFDRSDKPAHTIKKYIYKQKNNTWNTLRDQVSACEFYRAERIHQTLDINESMTLLPCTNSWYQHIRADK